MERNYKLGKFNTKVLFLRPDVAETATSDGDIVYVPCTSRYCELQDNINKAEIVSDAFASLQSFSLITWRIAGVTTDWRVEYEGKQYSIDRIIREDRFISRYEIRKTDLS